MRLKKKRRDMGGIPTASMSDISFCLLVFFLATTKFDIKKGLGMMLPAPSRADDVKVKIKDDNIAKLYIDREGRVAVNEVEVPLADLKPQIKQMVTDNPNLVISLKTDRRSRYANMITVLDRLRSAGAEKISLSTN
ncbi:MAG: biopolymer transporter ExbD [Candidatus Cloacimonetes bacterium]|nr:biopolymer transporter ExbD [Candidatus Cloacimonadota bacterium]